MTWKRVILAVLFLAPVALAPTPSFATTQTCFHYFYRACSGGTCCSAYCTECDYVGPNGEDQGYFTYCTGDSCGPEPM